MYTTENKPAKRFDYDAYIQARLAGKYVTAYIDEEISKQPLTDHINDNDEPVADMTLDTIVSKKEKGRSETGVTFAGSASLSAYPELTNSIAAKCEVIILYNIPFMQVPDINCRGAPLYRFSEALKS